MENIIVDKEENASSAILKRFFAILCLTIASILLIPSLILAAGGGSGGKSSYNPTPITTTPEKDCENLNGLQDRIQCRLEEKPAETEEEACRGLHDGGKCTRLYEISAKCYKKYGAEKDRCFKESSGFDGTGLSNESQESLKNYAILLLYDLQERIEEKYENGEISSKEASLLIENIVRMKKVLLQGGSGEQVRGMLSSFKQKWGEVME